VARATAARVFFTVASGGPLAAGGRMTGGASAAALAAPVLVAQPVLHLADGRVALLDKVRTRSAARRRLAELAVAAARGRPADLAVHYLGPDGPATELAGILATLIPSARQPRVTRGDAAIAAHAGPGMLGVVVVPG
jgi:fatty acid-binding protein DegV